MSDRPQSDLMNEGRAGRNIALVLSLFLIAVVSYRFPAAQRTLSLVLLSAGLAGIVIASMIVARDFWVSFPSERHRFANVIIILLFANMIAVPVYVLMTRKRIVAGLSREERLKAVQRPTRTASRG